ncbi:MAG TPA: hypothetical protein VGR38_10305, partial [Candidatus Polarisedimenticolia bacterium]|nr:hypothetical protein [Candidatus Polarisedimenticolia bacterium]
MSGLSTALPRNHGGPTVPRGRVGAGHLLAFVLAASGLAAGYLSWKLESVLQRFDTLEYFLDDPSGKMMLLKESLLLCGGLLALLALMSLGSWRLATGGMGAAMIVMAVLAGPVSKDYFAPISGLQESLVYRVRGLADVGLVGGLFLLVLAVLPGILASPPGAAERALRKCISLARSRWEGMSPWTRRISYGAVALVATLLVGRVVLKNFPNSSDENSYVTQARIFASGRLWIPSPAHPEFFRSRSFVLDPEKGRFFAKAFPGWSAFLTLGVATGMPSLVNPLLSALSLVLVGWVAANLLGKEAEMLVIVLLAASPFFVFNAASYFNHPLTLLLLTLFLACVVQLEKGGGSVWALLAGASVGAALTVRPASALLLSAPLVAWLGWRWAKSRNWRSLLAMTLPLVASVGLLALYNQALFGTPWRTGYQAYDPADIRPGLSIDNFLVTGWWLVKLLLWTLPGSLAGIFFLLRGRSLRSWMREEPLQALMAAGLVLHVAGHLVFQNKGSNEYGPRYYYDGFAYLALLTAAGWKRLGQPIGKGGQGEVGRRARAFILATAGALTIVLTLPLLFYHYSDKVTHNRDLYTRMEESGLTSAVVFLRTGSGRMPPGDLLRNPLDFRSGIVYVRDL